MANFTLKMRPTAQGYQVVRVHPGPAYRGRMAMPHTTPHEEYIGTYATRTEAMEKMEEVFDRLVEPTITMEGTR